MWEAREPERRRERAPASGDLLVILRGRTQGPKEGGRGHPEAPKVSRGIRWCRRDLRNWRVLSKGLLYVFGKSRGSQATPARVRS